MTWTRVTLQERIELAPGLARFRLSGHQPDFKPGQFVQLALDLDGERVGRPYSLCSAPGQDLEALIVRVDGGALTPSLFELPQGAPLWVHTAASGNFTLDRVRDAPSLWLISTGTGIAPYMSMIRHASLERFARVVFVHGVRRFAHLAYRREIEDRGFAHLPVVSREQGQGVLHGRIPDHLGSGALERLAGAKLDDSAQVLLCGNPAMITQVYGQLIDRGLTKNRPRKPGNITFEAYW
ncbi:MAG: ferredoxin--NADP+ reductase [Cognaticolwellia sp.]|jgi:ferredoxin--NADP+ reductase